MLSFDAGSWMAVIRLEGSTALIVLAVGQWVPASLMTTGANVAVLLFDESNPQDGLVVGSYGSAGLTTWPPAAHQHTANDIVNPGAGMAAFAEMRTYRTGSYEYAIFEDGTKVYRKTGGAWAFWAAMGGGIGAPGR